MRRKHVKGGPENFLEAQIEAEIVRRDQEALPESFYDFVKAAWHIVEPSNFVDGLNVHAICAHLQACAERRIRNLCINIAPRHSKSVLCSQLFPAWVLARNPKETLLYASHSAALSNRDSVKTRMVIESDWYQARWPNRIREDQNLKTAFALEAGGGRQATSVGGTVTGLGGSFLVLDDPIDAGRAESDLEREGVNTWFADAWLNRLAGDPNQAVRIVIMQRLHAHDVTAKCKELGFDMLILPTEYEGPNPPTSIGWVDPRNEFGALLWPERFTAATLKPYKNNAYMWASQYQQRPAPRSGGIIKARWVRYWYDPRLVVDPTPIFVPGEEGTQHASVIEPWIPPSAVDCLSSWDCSFKGGVKNDYVVGQVWTKQGANMYLLDQDRDNMSMPETCAAVRAQVAKWNPTPILIEGAANGPAVIQSLQAEVSGIIEVRPEGGKESRAQAIAPLFEAGNVYIPHPDMYPWVTSYVTEVTNFPRGTPHDDQMDSTSQALVRLRSRATVVPDLGAALGGQYQPDKGVQGLLVTEGSYWVQ
jgi:predicted phage terminase large subunit-like protein